MTALVAIAACLASIAGVCSLEFQHHNNSEYVTFLNEVAQTYPSLTRLYSIGKSMRGRKRYQNDYL